MFVGVGGTMAMCRHGEDGLWACHRSTSQYRAWRYWLSLELQRTFFGNDWLTVWGEWPPTTRDAADMVAASVSALRDEHDGKRGAISFKRVPRHPDVWTGFVPCAEDDERV